MSSCAIVEMQASADSIQSPKSPSSAKSTPLQHALRNVVRQAIGNQGTARELAKHLSGGAGLQINKELTPVATIAPWILAAKWWLLSPGLLALFTSLVLLYVPVSGSFLTLNFIHLVKDPVYLTQSSVGAALLESFFPLSMMGYMLVRVAESELQSYETRSRERSLALKPMTSFLDVRVNSRVYCPAGSFTRVTMRHGLCMSICTVMLPLTTGQLISHWEAFAQGRAEEIAMTIGVSLSLNAFFVLLIAGVRNSLKHTQDHLRGRRYEEFAGKQMSRALWVLCTNLLVLLYTFQTLVDKPMRNDLSWQFRNAVSRMDMLCVEGGKEMFHTGMRAWVDCFEGNQTCGYTSWLMACDAALRAELQSGIRNDALIVQLELIVCWFCGILLDSEWQLNRARRHIQSHMSAAIVLVAFTVVVSLWRLSRLLLVAPSMNNHISSDPENPFRFSDYPGMCWGDCDMMMMGVTFVCWVLALLLFNFDELVISIQERLYLQAVEDEEKPMRERVAEEQADGVCTFYFISAQFLRDRESTGTLPRMQDLMKEQPGQVVKQFTFRKHDAYHNLELGDRRDFVVVSHRWMSPITPDTDHEQYNAIVAFLRKPEHKHVKWVWYDFWSMPQKGRTRLEKLEFDHMLGYVNYLYLSCKVLILMDISYMSRFWTLFEAWLSMQECSDEGLRPAPPNARRCTVVPTGNGTNALGDQLIQMWAEKSPEQALKVLKKDDVTVTNAGDKTIQLKVLLDLHEEITRRKSKSTTGKSTKLTSSDRKSTKLTSSNRPTPNSTPSAARRPTPNSTPSASRWPTATSTPSAAVVSASVQTARRTTTTTAVDSTLRRHTSGSV